MQSVVALAQSPAELSLALQQSPGTALHCIDGAYQPSTEQADYVSCVGDRSDESGEAQDQPNQKHRNGLTMQDESRIWMQFGTRQKKAKKTIVHP